VPYAYPRTRAVGWGTATAAGVGVNVGVGATWDNAGAGAALAFAFDCGLGPDWDAFAGFGTWDFGGLAWDDFEPLLAPRASHGALSTSKAANGKMSARMDPLPAFAPHCLYP
jgi:hypothetical protein